VAEQLGDDDEVGAAPHQHGGEAVAQDVGGDVVVEPGPSGDAGDDVVGSLDGQAVSALSVDNWASGRSCGPSWPPLTRSCPGLDWLEITDRKSGAIQLTPLKAQPEPANLRRRRSST
jgi:hypothetical protein